MGRLEGQAKGNLHSFRMMTDRLEVHMALNGMLGP